MTYRDIQCFILKLLKNSFDIYVALDLTAGLTSFAIFSKTFGHFFSIHHLMSIRVKSLKRVLETVIYLSTYLYQKIKFKLNFGTITYPRKTGVLDWGCELKSWLLPGTTLESELVLLQVTEQIQH